MWRIRPPLLPDSAPLSPTPTTIPHQNLKQKQGRVLAADTSPAKGGPPRDAPLAEWNRVLGEDNVRMIFSSVWAERERGLRNVHSLIVARGGSDGGGIGGGGGASAAWRCVCGVLHTMAKDKVAPVYFAALEVLAAGGVYSHHHNERRLHSVCFNGAVHPPP